MRKKNLYNIFSIILFLLFAGSAYSEHFAVAYYNHQVGIYEQSTCKCVGLLKSDIEPTGIFKYGSDDVDLKDVELCFNPHDENFLLKMNGYCYSNKYELWNIKKNKVVFSEFLLRDGFAFSRSSPNLVAFLPAARKEILVYDYQRGDVVNVIPCDCESEREIIQFTRDGHLMLVLSNGEIRFYKIQEKEPFEKRNLGDFLILGRMCVNDQNGDIFFTKGSFCCTHKRFVIVNTRKLCFEEFKNYRAHEVINKNFIAIETGDSKIHIFNVSTMKEITSIKWRGGLYSAKFLNESIIYLSGGEVIILNYLTKKWRSIPIPHCYKKKRLSWFWKIRKKRDYFILAMVVEPNKIIFLDSRDNSWKEFIDESGRGIVDVGFLPDSKDRKMDHLIKKLNKLKLDKV